MVFAKEINIGNIVLGGQHPVAVIAEVGVNHNGDLAVAKKMVTAAAAAGADIVKFQTFTTEEFMSDTGLVYEYEEQGKIKQEDMFAMFKRLELPYAWHEELARHCQAEQVQFLSTPCDTRAVELLDKLNVPTYKISSEDLINIDLLECVAATKKPVLLSTGMANESEIDQAVDIFRRQGHQDLVLLHCTSLYPTPPEAVNLARLRALAEKYAVLTGFSDHTDGSAAACGAVYLGAVVIEKHFTLSRQLAGPDHRFSQEPNELKEMVAAIRAAEVLHGAGAPP